MMKKKRRRIELRELTKEQKGVLETYFKTTNQITLEYFPKDTPIQIIKNANQCKRTLEALNDYETMYQDCERYLNDLLMNEKIKEKEGR